MIALTLTATLMLVILATLAMALVCRLHRPMNPTPLGVAFLTLLTTHYLPSIVYLFDPLKTEALAFHWACTVSLVLLPLGGWAANVAARFKPGTIDAYFRTVSSRSVSRGDIRLVQILGVACVLVFAGYVYEVPIWPFRRIVEDGISASLETAAMRKLTTGPTMPSQWWYLYSFARIYFMPLLFCALIFCWPRLGFLQKIWAVGVMLMVLVYNSWTGQKVPVAMLFLIAAIACLPKVWNYSRQRLARLRVTALVILLVGSTLTYPILVFQLQLFGQTHSLGEILVEGVFKRLFGTPALLSYQQFELFSITRFTYWSDIRKLADLVGLEYTNLSELTSTLGDADRLYNAPPAALGNFYAQAGWPMIVAGMLLAGLTLQALLIWTLRRAPSSGLSLVVLAMLTFGGFRLSMTSFHSVLFTESLLPTVLVVLIWRASESLSPRRKPLPQGAFAVTPQHSPSQSGNIRVKLHRGWRPGLVTIRADPDKYDGRAR